MFKYTYGIDLKIYTHIFERVSNIISTNYGDSMYVSKVMQLMHVVGDMDHITCQKKVDNFSYERARISKKNLRLLQKAF